MLPLFQIFIMTLIIVNTVTLAMDRYPSLDATTESILTYLNYYFTAAFTIECILKVIGLGFRQWARD